MPGNPLQLNNSMLITIVSAVMRHMFKDHVSERMDTALVSSLEG